ncbi:MauE/DoxX family redox-associated membrane protein [Pedobacter heparinus]|uniref:MauE/DoxX family redox-associated membrane protein n=1 Tax=Pedobacter heparinus TaxID=984 RepID=UPI002930B3D9|nr:MauE/DoxX family redox-associated membrane protein [Pedobacter heparinus]
MRTKEFLTGLFSGILILVFFYSGLDKLWHLNSFGNIVSKSPLIGHYSELIMWLVPVSELVICILLFIPKFRFVGFCLSFLMMLCFTLYIGYMIAYVPQLPCNCGGITKYMNWHQHLYFNVGLTLLALWGILIETKRRMDYRIKNDEYNRKS